MTGDEWMDDAEVQGEPMTIGDACKFRKMGTRILWMIPEMRYPVEGMVIEVSVNRKFVRMRSGMTPWDTRCWLALERVHLCSILATPEQLTVGKVKQRLGKKFEEPTPTSIHECTCGRGDCPICGIIGQ